MRDYSRVSSFTAGIGRWLMVSLLCLAAFLAVSCNDKPTVIKSLRYKSPDGKWEAVVECVDNGLGFGLGALYNEVHLVETGMSISQHGEDCSNVLFFRDSSEESEITTQITWLDSKHLQIKYPANPKPGRALAEYRSFSVLLVPIATATK